MSSLEGLEDPSSVVCTTVGKVCQVSCVGLVVKFCQVGIDGRAHYCLVCGGWESLSSILFGLDGVVCQVSFVGVFEGV